MGVESPAVTFWASALSLCLPGLVFGVPHLGVPLHGQPKEEGGQALTVSALCLSRGLPPLEDSRLT